MRVSFFFGRRGVGGARRRARVCVASLRANNTRCLLRAVPANHRASGYFCGAAIYVPVTLLPFFVFFAHSVI